MRRLFYLLAGIAVSLLMSCENSEQIADTSLRGYQELIDAHAAGRVYKEVQKRTDANVVWFEDGSRAIVPFDSFMIYDHTETPVPEIIAIAGSPYWKVDGKLTDIKILATDTPSADAEPVYVYYNSKAVYMYLSNRQVLTLKSQALIAEEEEKLYQEMIARRQNLPTVHIDTKGQGIYDKDNYVNGTITIKDYEKLYSDVTEFSAEMGIRGRGNSTWSFPKKPYKIKLKEKASIFGMGADKEWCLLANYADRTLLRNIVAMRMSEMCGFAWTPHMYCVHVYLNNRYLGVYTLCEHKKVSTSRVDIDVDAGDVYLEIEEQQDETTCWWTGMGVPMMFSDPEEPSAELLDEVKQWFADFEASLYSDYLADPEKGYAAYIDVDSFIDYYIIQEMSKNTDGNLRKSSFITKKKGGKLVMYHLWDFDLTFGNMGWDLHEPEGFYILTHKSDCNWGDNWFNRMAKDPVFVKKLKKRFNELVPQFQTIPAFINEQALILSKAQELNFQVWDINEYVDWTGCPSLGSYEAEVEFLKDFFTKRLEWMRNAINKM